MNKLCIYHANCADGAMSAAIIYAEYGDEFEYVAASYGDAPPDVTGKEVFVVDFSYPRDVLTEMAESAALMVVLDHHKTAQEELQNLELPNTEIHFDMEKSGAGLVWSFLHDSPMPRIVAHVQDRDLWNFDLLGTREVMAAVFSYGFDIKKYSTWVRGGSAACEQLMSEGTVLRRKYDQDLATILKSSHRGHLAGHSVPFVNAPPMFASEAGNILSKGEPFAVVYNFATKNDGGLECRLSLRSDGQFDVSAVAKQMGGGGHRAAAGCALPARADLFNLKPGLVL